MEVIIPGRNMDAELESIQFSISMDGCGPDFSPGCGSYCNCHCNDDR